MIEDGPRFVVDKVHMTALEKRLYPEASKKPYVVVDTAERRLLGLPDRYTNRSGAQARADRENAAQATEGKTDAEAVQ